MTLCDDMINVEDIKYCPICSSDNIDKVKLKTDMDTVGVDYYCKNCGGNGDLLLSKSKE